MEHSQEEGFLFDDDLHFFTIGAGSLMDGEGLFWDLVDNVPPEWPCDRENKSNGVSYCHFGWYTKASDGGYGIVEIDSNFATVKLIGSTNDKLLHEAKLRSRIKN